MHLLDSELRNKEEWEAAGIELPKFDREAMKAATRECPYIIFFAILAPLALYRGPMNMFGLGSGIAALIIGLVRRG